MGKTSKDGAVSAANSQKMGTTSPPDTTIKVGSGTGGGGQNPPPNDPQKPKNKPKP